MLCLSSPEMLPSEWVMRFGDEALTFHLSAGLFVELWLLRNCASTAGSTCRSLPVTYPFAG
jgi:hypothetical protein